MTESKKEFLKGTLDLLVLKVVASGPKPRLRHRTAPETNIQDFFQVHQGSLYPALHRLEDRGLLAAEWEETETGREAKIYRLTEKAAVISTLKLATGTNSRIWSR